MLLLFINCRMYSTDNMYCRYNKMNKIVTVPPTIPLPSPIPQVGKNIEIFVLSFFGPFFSRQFDFLVPKAYKNFR